MTERWQIEFTRIVPPYFVGDVAGFSPDVARLLVGKGAALHLRTFVGEDLVWDASAKPEPKAEPVPVVVPGKPAKPAG